MPVSVANSTEGSDLASVMAICFLLLFPNDRIPAAAESTVQVHSEAQIYKAGSVSGCFKIVIWARKSKTDGPDAGEIPEVIYRLLPFLEVSLYPPTGNFF